jgi:hypothetical protein
MIAIVLFKSIFKIDHCFSGMSVTLFMSVRELYIIIVKFKICGFLFSLCMVFDHSILDDAHTLPIIEVSF